MINILALILVVIGIMCAILEILKDGFYLSNIPYVCALLVLMLISIKYFIN